MAEEKPGGSSSDASTLSGVILAILIILFLITAVDSFVDTNKFAKYFYDVNTEGQKVFLPSFNLKLGDFVINKNKVSIRQIPGGGVIGSQAKRIKGRLIEGPIRKFDQTWWRIDYPSAPDGWVSASDFTNKVTAFSIMNFIPISISYARPIIVFLSILVFFLIAVVFLKNADLLRTLKKKKVLDQERKIIEKEGTKEEIPESDFPVPDLPVGERPKTEDLSKTRWANIQSLIRSYNSNDWKQAIIEADIILEEMLEKMGYQGESVGDRLKLVEQSDFMTLNAAWEAHKFRNKIAHGSSYILDKSEAQRIIDLYAKVFKEFFYI